MIKKPKNKKININGRELNFIQAYLFNKNSRIIIKSLYILGVIFLIFELFLGVYLVDNTNRYMIIPVVSLMILTGIKFPDIVENKVFVGTGSSNMDIENNLSEALNSSWIITSDMIEYYLSSPWYKEEEEIFKIIKNSSGHQSIENLQKNVMDSVPSIIKSIKSPTEDIIEKALYKYGEEGGGWKFNNIQIFKDKPYEKLAKYYCIINNIPLYNEFAQKAVKFKSKEDFISCIDEKLVRVSG